jgi:AbrB family looped-hinge helix DNA binding protein
MSATGKIQNNGQVTIPTSVRRQAGLAKGDLVNFVFQRGKIIITPRLVIDRSKFPTADDEYTPEQRAIVDARIAEARKGPYYGPFKNGAEVDAFLKKWKAKGKPVKSKKLR